MQGLPWEVSAAVPTGRDCRNGNGSGKGAEKSAEAIVVPESGDEGPNPLLQGGSPRIQSGAGSGLDGHGAAVMQGLPTVPVRGGGGGHAPRRRRRRRNPWPAGQEPDCTGKNSQPA